MLKGASPADARRYAAVRVFGGINGNYGSGIMDMVEAGDRWKDRSEVAHTYLANMGAAARIQHLGADLAGPCL